MGELHFLRQFLDQGIWQNDELLIGGRVNIELKAFLLEYLFHLHRHLDSVAGEVEIEIVGEEGFELQTYQGAFGYHGTVLLLDREEMLVSLPIGEYHRFATESTNLCTSDIEHVAMARQIGSVMSLPSAISP